MIIDIHAHLLPQGTLDALAARPGQFPSVSLLHDADEVRLAFAGGPPTRPIMPALRHFEPRQRFLAGAGELKVDAGGWLDSFGYELPAECRDRDGVLPLATVPLQSGVLAARVLREAVRDGMPGAMIGTQNRGTAGSLDDPDLDPFWETAAELAVPVIVHPMFGSADARLHDMQMMNAVGRVSDVSTAVSRLLFKGHLSRFAGLVLVASTGGGALPYMLGRLERNHRAFPDLVVDPVEQFALLYFDSVVFQPRILRFLVEMAGVERIMLGSDYPFPIGDPDPRAVVERAGLGAGAAEAMFTGTARRLFGV